MALVENITFSEAEDKDLSFIRNLSNYYVEKSTANFYQHELNIDEIKNLIFYDDRRYRCFVISSNGKKVGFIYLSPYSLRESYRLTANVSVYLDFEYTGRGIGTAANAFIENYAKKQGFHSLLMFISDDNIQSRKSAERNGYTLCGFIKEVGFKFNKWLGLAIYQKIL